MNAWNLTKNLIEIMSDIDSKIELRSKTSMAEKWLMIDADIIRLEALMFEIISTLKEIEIPEKSE